MVSGMATAKVTITLDENELAKVRALVATKRSPSVSGFIQHAVRLALADVDGWSAALRQSLDDTGGPLTAEERAWADGILGKKRGRAA
jgi:Arc/MetJ-type ribon-helix-helix transcriptional regulator